MSQSSLRGHSLKFNKKRVRLDVDVAKFSFSNRVVNEWNILDEEIISGCSSAVFKRKLDCHLSDKRGYICISFSFLPLYRQLDDLDSLMHQVQVQVPSPLSPYPNPFLPISIPPRPPNNG